MNKSIKGFPSYKIDSSGQVISYKCGKTKILKPRIGKFGYLYLNLTKDGKYTTKKIHRLIAEAFIDNPDNKPMVNHLNGIKTDNSIANLEWCTSKENINHAVDNGLIPFRKRSKLNQYLVRQIKELHKTGKFTLSKLSEQFGVSDRQISKIVNNLQWKDVLL